MKRYLNKYKYLICLFAAAGFLAFFYLGGDRLDTFDESRNGVNAYEMLENGDWINLYFGGKPDEWNVKPPLFIWNVALAFKVFGYSSWALRFPSAVSTILCFFFLYQLIRLYKSQTFALLTCLLTTSVNGIIGFHVGRTGDFDAMLLAFLLGFIYFLVRYLEQGKTTDVYLASAFLGFAFMTKGWAFIQILPGVALLLWYKKGFLKFFSSIKSLGAIVLFALFPIGWFLCIKFYGAPHQGLYGGSNAFETMFWYDIVERFTAKGFEGDEASTNFIEFIPKLDSKFNLWNYFLYLSILLSGYLILFKNKRFSIADHPLLILTCCIWLPIALFLNFGSSQRTWYVAPVIPFIGVTTYYIYDILKSRFKFLPYVFFVLLAFTLVRKGYEHTIIDPTPEIISNNQELFINAGHIVRYGNTDWDDANILLDLLFLNRNVSYDNHQLEFDIIDPIIVSKRKFIEKIKQEYPDFTIISDSEDYVILTKNKDDV